jgi:hypothetical protein
MYAYFSLVALQRVLRELQNHSGMHPPVTLHPF